MRHRETLPFRNGSVPKSNGGPPETQAPGSPAGGIIAALEHAGHGKSSTSETTLLIFAFLSLAASPIVMMIRPFLVRRGLMKPLSKTADRAADSAGTGAVGR